MSLNSFNNNKKLDMLYKKEVLKIHRKLDDSIVDILFNVEIHELETLANDFLNEVLNQESILLNKDSSVEDKIKALEFYGKVLDNEKIYKMETDKFLSNKGVCESLGEGIHKTLYLKNYDMVNNICSTVLEDFMNLNRSFSRNLSKDKLRLNSKIFSKVLSNKVSICSNIVLEETVVPCMQAFTESALRVRNLLEEELKREDLDNTKVNIADVDLIRNDTRSRSLNTLAKNNDFILLRQKGSHAQFKHTDGRLVTIPQGRIVGKGLSLRIQKDLQSV